MRIVLDNKEMEHILKEAGVFMAGHKITRIYKNASDKIAIEAEIVLEDKE